MSAVYETLAKLPEMCAARHPTTNNPIMLKRGCLGYWEAPPSLDVDAYNARHGITAAQVIAMEIGSHFGFDVPGADPDIHAR